MQTSLLFYELCMCVHLVCSCTKAPVIQNQDIISLIHFWYDTQTGYKRRHQTVNHCHFIGWPDHGVPKHAVSLISFIRHIRKLKAKAAPPMLVHCSAGVGRSGTFILIDSMLDRLEHKDSLNVYEFLWSMRRNRVFMVQTVVGVVILYFIPPLFHFNQSHSLA